MDRINSSGTILDASGHRVRVSRNTATGVPGTELDPGYDNGLQEEMMNIISHFGLTPDAANLSQILTCMLMLPRVGRLIFLSVTPGVGGFVIPADVTAVFAILTGGGGGGAGATSSGGQNVGGLAGNAGGGGGAGGTMLLAGPVTPGQGFSYTIGGGGTGGYNGTNGASGQQSALGTNGQNVFAPGGDGGANVASSSNQAGGGGGGPNGQQQFSGALNGFVGIDIPGGFGGDGSAQCNICGGYGGASWWGGGGRAGTAGGAPGTAWGSGAGAGYTPTGLNGGVGGGGILAVFG